MQLETTTKLKQYISSQKNKQYISSKVLFAKEIGITPQMLYIKLKSNTWSSTDIFAIQKILSMQLDDNISNCIKAFIEKQKVAKDLNKVTSKSIADKLEISVSLLYKRMKNNNWKEPEIVKINSL